MKKIVVWLSASSRVSWLQVWKQMHVWHSLPISTCWWWEVTSARGREKKVPKEQLLFWGKKGPRLCIYRSWQAGHRKPWTSIRFFFRRDVHGGSNARHSRLVTHIPLKERSQKRKVMLQKWWHKNGSTAVILTSANTERDLFHEQKRLVTWQQ